MAISKFREPCLVLREKTFILFFLLLKEARAHFLGYILRKREMLTFNAFIYTY